ncbi:ABC transporter ATP-binding protein [Tabrizicola sp. WMC-M-20]|nr:ABC transporter ATP-binding protein [Tabrizicola sp. WMC-M-20]
MKSVFSKIYDLLDQRERRRAVLLFLLFLITGLADLIGAASILPFLAMVADPEAAREQALVASIYDWFGFTDSRSFLIFLGLAVLAIMLVTLVIRLFTLRAMARFAYGRNHAVSSRLLSAYLRQPYVWFLHRNTADLSRTVLSEAEQVIMQALLPATKLVANAVTILCLVALLLAINPFVALSTALVLGGAYTVLSFIVRKALNRAAAARAEANRARYRLAQEALAGIKDLKILGAEERYIARYNVMSQRFAQAGSTTTIIGEMPRYVLEMIAFGGMVLLVLVLILTGSGSLTEILPLLGVFAFSGLKIFPALQQIYLALTQIRSVGPMLDNLHRDVLETLRVPQSEQRKSAGCGTVDLTRTLRLAGVSYAYPQATRPALKGLDLAIAARSTVGIVGGSGAGKTTVIDVLLGLLEPQAGTILVDDTPIVPENLRQWQDMIGYVPQTIFLIDGTVAENIALGVAANSIDMAAVTRAADIARLHDFVTTEMPDGYQTNIGDRGLRLSGGQRQRIGIARALYHDPKVLVLDEATAALDNLTEQAFMEAVQALGGKKTIIMIAHRLSTVQDCDCIHLMEHGQIVASGTYEDLVAGNDVFRRMARG